MIVAIPTSFIVIGIFAAIASMVLLYMLLYRYWELIQDGYHRGDARPGSWLHVYPILQLLLGLPGGKKGLAEDMNRYTQERGIAAPQANTGLALTYCILICVRHYPGLKLFDRHRRAIHYVHPVVKLQGSSDCDLAVSRIINKQRIGKIFSP